MVSKAYNKVTIMCTQYNKLNGNIFADTVRLEFLAVCEQGANLENKHFLQDGEPRQNFAQVNKYIADIGAMVLQYRPTALT